jgi:hypothetical protein
MPAKFEPPPGAADDDVRVVAGGLELRQRLLADHRLVQQHVVEHRPEGVLRVVALRGDLDGLGDGDAEAARVIGTRVEHARPDAVSGEGDATHRAP